MQEQLNILIWEISKQNAWVLPLCFALFGACIGSFLNVVIYRMPRGLSVNEPRRSYCPTCNKEIPWYLNIPLLSWLLLRGKSACCGQRISVRYWLVELACTLFFAATAYYLGQEQSVGFFALVFICIWGAAMLATLCIDWEQMIVLPGITLVAAAAGLLAVLSDPYNLFNTYEWSDAMLLSLGSGLGAFVLLKAIGLLGRAMFGNKNKNYTEAKQWSLQQVGDDIELKIDNESYAWSELFMESNNRVQLQEATICTEAEQAPCTITFGAESATLADGSIIHLEEHERLDGTCKGITTRKEAMGSGDAWIALSIGVLCGGLGCCFALVAGSVLGLAWALIAGIRKGQPMPFGPVLIMGAWLYLFCGKNWLDEMVSQWSTVL